MAAAATADPLPPTPLLLTKRCGSAAPPPAAAASWSNTPTHCRRRRDRRRCSASAATVSTRKATAAAYMTGVLPSPPNAVGDPPAVRVLEGRCGISRDAPVAFLFPGYSVVRLKLHARTLYGAGVGGNFGRGGRHGRGPPPTAPARGEGEIPPFSPLAHGAAGHPEGGARQRGGGKRWACLTHPPCIEATSSDGGLSVLHSF